MTTAAPPSVPPGRARARAAWIRQLRTGRPIWERTRLKPLPTEVLERDVTTDALVVGAGISGAVVAESLVSAGLRVRVVDRLAPAHGSTVASTALLLYATDRPLAELSRDLGRDRAERAWRRSHLAVAALRERSERLGLLADVQPRPSLYLEGTELDAAGLAAEARERRRAGFDCEVLAPFEVETRTGVAGRAALLGFGAMTADPRRLAVGFLRRAIEGGGVLHTPVDVVGVAPGPDHVLAATRHGPTIRARHLVYATGYDLPDGVPNDGHRVVSTWVITTRPQRNGLWWRRSLIWEASRPYLYLRTGPGRRVICGGEDECVADPAARDALLPAKTRALMDRLASLFPHLDPTPECAWGASFGDSASGLPTIGAVPGAPRCYALLGYGGNGITFAMLGAQILRGLITGDGDADADLFAFGSHPGQAGPEAS